jgi:hypothetical protein
VEPAATAGSRPTRFSLIDTPAAGPRERINGSVSSMLARIEH